jgi:hypothetical protein
MKLSRDRFYKLNKDMLNIDSKKYNKYFLFMISYNKKLIEPIVEEIELKAKDVYTKEFYEYQRRSNKIFESHQDEETIANEFKILNEEFKESIETFKISIPEFEKWISEDIELELRKIEFVHVPDELEKSVYESLEILFMEP